MKLVTCPLVFFVSDVLSHLESRILTHAGEANSKLGRLTPNKKPPAVDGLLLLE